MKNLCLLSLLSVLVLLTSCGTFTLPGFKKEPPKTAHQLFQENEEYPAFYTSYKDEELLAQASGGNTQILVDISDQRAFLLVNDSVAVDVPCSTGRTGKETPIGSFNIMEKLVKKKSNIYGTVYNGSKVVHRGDQRKYTGPRTNFIGTSLPYWMRLTNDGIGLHFSNNVKRYPASGGCIRMPMDGIQTMYSKVERGTLVTIQP